MNIYLVWVHMYVYTCDRVSMSGCRRCLQRTPTCTILHRGLRNTQIITTWTAAYLTQCGSALEIVVHIVLALPYSILWNLFSDYLKCPMSLVGYR